MKLTYRKTLKLPGLKVRWSNGRAVRTWHFGPSWMGLRNHSSTGRTTIYLPMGLALAGSTRTQRARKRAHRAKARLLVTQRPIVREPRLQRTTAAFAARWHASGLAPGSAHPRPVPSLRVPARSFRDELLADTWQRAHGAGGAATHDIWGEPLPVPEPTGTHARTERTPAGHHRCRARNKTNGKPCRRIVVDGGSCPAHPRF